MQGIAWSATTMKLKWTVHGRLFPTTRSTTWSRPMVALTSALRDRWVTTRALYSASFCPRRADGSTGRVANAEKRKISRQVRSYDMRRIAPVIALVAALIAPAFAQKAEIEAVNVKWIEVFNKGDFAGVASLYTEDAMAFPPGSGMVKGEPRSRHCG